jgi:hypothetical protein
MWLGFRQRTASTTPAVEHGSPETSRRCSIILLLLVALHVVRRDHHRPAVTVVVVVVAAVGHWSRSRTVQPRPLLFLRFVLFNGVTVLSIDVFNPQDAMVIDLAARKTMTTLRHTHTSQAKKKAKEKGVDSGGMRTVSQNSNTDFFFLGVVRKLVVAVFVQTRESRGAKFQ